MLSKLAFKASLAVWRRRVAIDDRSVFLNWLDVRLIRLGYDLEARGL